MNNKEITKRLLLHSSGKYILKRLDENASSQIKELFVNVFSNEPWNDDWSDENQLQRYIHDLIGQNNSLSFGLFSEDRLIGLSLGHIRHWYSGTEYFIDELCISTHMQGKGIGTIFVSEIEKACKEIEVKHLFLLTDNNAPAFSFYKKLGFDELETKVAFVKQL